MQLRDIRKILSVSIMADEIDHVVRCGDLEVIRLLNEFCRSVSRFCDKEEAYHLTADSERCGEQWDNLNEDRLRCLFQTKEKAREIRKAVMRRVRDENT